MQFGDEFSILAFSVDLPIHRCFNRKSLLLSPIAKANVSNARRTSDSAVHAIVILFQLAARLSVGLSHTV